MIWPLRDKCLHSPLFIPQVTAYIIRNTSPVWHKKLLSLFRPIYNTSSVSAAVRLMYCFTSTDNKTVYQSSTENLKFVVPWKKSVRIYEVCLVLRDICSCMARHCLLTLKGCCSFLTKSHLFLFSHGHLILNVKTIVLVYPLKDIEFVTILEDICSSSN